MNKIFPKKIVLLLIISFLFFACEKEEETVNVLQKNEGKSKINFSPTEATWFKRIPPDSLVIDILDGEPPYSIVQKSKYYDAEIKGSQLIIYPEPLDLFSDPLDFINIRDSYGNANAFNINLKIKKYYFDKIESFSINTTGDTNIVRNAMQLDGLVLWDPVIGYLEFTVKQDSLILDILNFGVDSVGTQLYKSGVFFLGADNRTYQLGNNYIEPFRINNTQQFMTITELSKSAIKGNFAIMATSKNRFDIPIYNVTVNCSFSFSNN